MKYRLANQPKELIHSLPELLSLRQRLAVKQRNLADNIAKAQNQTAANQRGNNGAKISPSALITRCNPFCCAVAAAFTASLETPSIPAREVNS